ncbi:MAG: NUDIX hydrolase, partial [bacterium]
MQGFAGVVVFREGSVLLVNERDYFTGEPRWSFPSGHIEDGEDPAIAAVRELAEESGC